MNPQYQQQYQPNIYSQNSAYDEQTKRWRQRLAIAVVVAIIGWVVYSIVSAYTTRQNTGVLVITPSAPSAIISAQQAGTEQVKLGKGSTKVRLKPGTYTITASGDDKAASQVVSITKQRQTNLTLTLSNAVPVQHIAKYSGQYLYAAPDNSLYFMNVLEGVPYTFPLGGEEARPYLTDINDITAMQWLSPMQVIYENSAGETQYSNSDTTRSLTYGDETPTSGSVSTNTQGAVAFVASDKTIVRAEPASRSVTAIATAPSDNTQTSIAPNGDILTYTPRRSLGDPQQQSVLYTSNTTFKLPGTLTGIINAAWRADSTAFSYATTGGLFVYDLASHTTTQITEATPTNSRAMLWADSNTIVYVYDHALWRYDLRTKTSSKLATIQGDMAAQQNLSLGPDAKTIYFSTTANSQNQGGAIYSVIYNYNQLSKTDQEAARAAQRQASQHTITYTGLSALQDSGMSFDQAKSARYAIGMFAGSLNPTPNNIRILNPSLELKPGTTDTIRFSIGTDRGASYKAAVDVTSIITIRLYVYDQSGAVIYDSQPIDAQ